MKQRNMRAGMHKKHEYFRVLIAIKMLYILKYKKLKGVKIMTNETIENKMIERINSKIKYVTENFTAWNKTYEMKMAEIDGMIEMLSIVTGKNYIIMNELREEVIL